MSNKGGAAGFPSMTTCNPRTVVERRVCAGVDSVISDSVVAGRHAVLDECHAIRSESTPADHPETPSNLDA
ncbi:hypothetical protein ACRU3B_14290 [Mycobacterium colombiense]|uniref:hypothetical protein n=1 Tax=Mycobacterium colombiense TaxID=339268 RepID=UPI00142EAAB4|nr:hypothetical protein [Mycobacterium colombiense]